MSDPFTELCVYCGSPEVLDDSWFCDDVSCYWAYQRDEQDEAEYEFRTPLTFMKADSDMWITRASVWGTPYLAMERAAEKHLTPRHPL
jgi:hypothetical protein